MNNYLQQKNLNNKNLLSTPECRNSCAFQVIGKYTLAKAPFTWRKVVLGKRVTLSAESTLARVHMRKKLTPLPESSAGFPMTTVLAHAQIIWP